MKTEREKTTSSSRCQNPNFSHPKTLFDALFIVEFSTLFLEAICTSLYCQSFFRVKIEKCLTEFNIQAAEKPQLSFTEGQLMLDINPFYRRTFTQHLILNRTLNLINFKVKIGQTCLTLRNVIATAVSNSSYEVEWPWSEFRHVN